MTFDDSRGIAWLARSLATKARGFLAFRHKARLRGLGRDAFYLSNFINRRWLDQNTGASVYSPNTSRKTPIISPIVA